MLSQVNEGLGQVGKHVRCKDLCLINYIKKVIVWCKKENTIVLSLPKYKKGEGNRKTILNLPLSGAYQMLEIKVRKNV